MKSEMLLAVLLDLRAATLRALVLVSVAGLAATAATSARGASVGNGAVQHDSAGESRRAIAERAERVTSRWTLDSDGLWFDGSAWSNGAAPNNSPDQRVDVVIDRPVGASYRIDFLGDDATVASLALDATDATLRLLGNTLTVEEAVDVRAGAIELDGGSLHADSLAISAGQVALRSGSLDITNSLGLSGGEFLFAGGILRNAMLNAAESGFRFEGAGSKTLENTSITNGLLSVGASEVRLIGGLSGANGGGLAIAESGRLIIEGNQSVIDATLDAGLGRIDVNGDVSFERSTLLLGPGTPNLPSGAGIGLGEFATLRIDSESTVQGTANFFAAGNGSGPRSLVNAGSIRTDPLFESRIVIGFNIDDLINTGEIVADTGRIFIQTRSVENQGLIRAVNAGRLSVEGNITGAGQLIADGGEIARRGIFTTAGLGNLQAINGGVVRIEGSWMNTDATIVLDASTGSWELAGGIVGGIVEMRNGASLRPFGNIVTIDGTEFRGNDFVVDNPTDLRLVNAPRFAESTLVIGPTADVSYVGEMVLSDEFRVRIDRGTLTTASATTLTVAENYTLVANSGVLGSGDVFIDGRIELTALPEDAGSQPRLVIGGRSIVNAGVIVDTDDTVGGSLILNAQETRNDGIIELLRGRGLQTTGMFTNTNQIVLGGGAESRFVGPFRNEGTMVLQSGSLQIDTLENLGSIQVNGGVLTLAGDRSSEELTGISATGGEVRLEGTIENTGRTLALNASTGQWTFAGLLRGGELSATDGLELWSQGGIFEDLHVIDTDLVAFTRGFEFRGATLGSGFKLEGGDVRVRGNSILFVNSSGEGPTLIDGDIRLEEDMSILEVTGSQDWVLDGFSVFGASARNDESILQLRGNAGLRVAEGSVVGDGALSISGLGRAAPGIVNDGVIHLVGDDLRVSTIAIGGSGEFRVGAGTRLNLIDVQFELDNGAFTGSMTFLDGSQTTVTTLQDIAPITRIANDVVFSGAGASTQLFTNLTRNDGRVTITRGAVATLGGLVGAVENAGRMQISAGSALIVTPGLDLLEEGVLELGLGLNAANAPGVGQVLSLRDAALGGTLEIVLEEPLQLAVGERIQFLSSNRSVSGEFDFLLLPTLANGNLLTVEYSATAVELVVVVPAPSGAGALLLALAGVGVSRQRRAA